MPIFLRAPQREPQNDNRLNIMATWTPHDQCALMPTDYSHFLEVFGDTTRARWGGFGPCTSGGACEGCPTKQPTTLRSFTPKVLARLDPARPGVVFLVNNPEHGWSSISYQWTWTELNMLDGWTLGERYKDQHSDGLWLVATRRSKQGFYGVGDEINPQAPESA